MVVRSKKRGILSNKPRATKSFGVRSRLPRLSRGWRTTSIGSSASIPATTPGRLRLSAGPRRAARRRPRSRTARREPHRPPVYRATTPASSLYKTLHGAGIREPRRARPSRDDGLEAHRLPRDQRREMPAARRTSPGRTRSRRCNRYLAQEIDAVRPRAILALGAIAHRAVLLAFGLAPGRHRFAHHAEHELPSSAALR